MEIRQVKSKEDLSLFYELTKKVYKDNNCYRATEDDLIKLIIEGPTCFHSHAKVLAFLVLEGNDVVARFVLIYDKLLFSYVQISFFEAFPGLTNLLENIIVLIKRYFPTQRRFVVGLNGHLNYGAGFLLNRFDEPPLFGLSYSPPYYPNYFCSLKKHLLMSFRFSIDRQHKYLAVSETKYSFGNFKVRRFSKKKLKEEIKIYTYLNNACFHAHPFWANRSWEEDYELFHSFRFLINEENLLFVENNGKPIGFLLWYPDFNLLVSNQRGFNLFDIVKYRFKNPINTLRFTEIGILPKYRRTLAVLALIREMALFWVKDKYDYCECGFIFQENKESIRMTRRYLERITGQKLEPYRYFAVYEGEL